MVYKNIKVKDLAIRCDAISFLNANSFKSLPLWVFSAPEPKALLLWNRRTEFNETLQEARLQRPLPILCFSDRFEKQDGRPGLRLAETFSTFPLKLLNGIHRNLTWSKISTSSTKFVFFEMIGKTRLPPWPLIGWDIFDFSSKTAERKSTKLDWKQDFNVLYQVYVYLADRKTRWLPWPLIDWDIFDFSSATTERNSTKLDRKQDLNVLYQVCVFRADLKNKMAFLSDLSIKVAHCTQVHDMWHFGPLVYWNENRPVFESQRTLTLCGFTADDNVGSFALVGAIRKKYPPCC